MARKAKPPTGRTVEALRHEEAKRRNIPTAEYQTRCLCAYERRTLQNGTPSVKMYPKRNRSGSALARSLWKTFRPR